MSVAIKNSRITVSPYSVHHIDAIIMSADKEAAQAVVGNNDVYVNEDLFFWLLQDKGQLMSDKERDRFENGKNKSRAAVKGKIHFRGLLYPSLYKLAEEVYKKMGDHDNLFPMLPNNKNKTKAIIEYLHKNPNLVVRDAMKLAGFLPMSKMTRPST